ncbi:DUF2497 domain-containing protein [Faunimonas sp. B44]|uniref:DUF2497 domain-containing protein n=1 Tax=Faunimonas sp. B44 TaxID=3461493 RepID=UPI0040450A90
MEEILASIRQIISEDENAPGAGLREGSVVRAVPEPGPGPSSGAEPLPHSEPQALRTEQQRPTPALQAVEPAARPRPGEPPAAPALKAAPPAGAAPAPRSEPPRSEPPRTEQARAATPSVVASATPERYRQPAPAVGVEDDRLLSPGAGAAVSGAFSALAHTILAQNARTLEDLVSEMLRPMLKNWLDENLPPLVERLVREEIERVSRGRR